MAAEEDKKFDAVLGGFLVNGLRVRSGQLQCPESDVLAAYHERSLLPEEMSSWKEHIVGCARCQAILSGLEATDSIPLQAPETVSRDQVPLTGAAGRAAVAREEQIAPAAKGPEKPPRGVPWQWLAPAGALAAGLLVWVAWHENQLPRWKAPPEVKMARVEPPAASAPRRAVTGQAPTSSSPNPARQDQVASLSRDEGAAGGMTSAKTEPEAKKLKPLEKSESHAQEAAPKPPVDKEAGAHQDTGRHILAVNPSQNQPAQDTRAPGAVSEALEVQAQAENALPQKQQTQQDQSNAQKLPGPSHLAQADQTKKAKSESRVPAYRAATVAPVEGPPLRAPAVALNEVSAPRGLLTAASNLTLIAAPNKKTLWRAGHAGMIEFSNDAGASWLRQTSGVLAELTAGSAPSDKICWIVGRAGTILLTTDAGAHWAVVRSPVDEDLGGVRATDALHATVWNLGNTKILETSDGGLTWNPVASQ
jgi:hypothetical protein